MVVCSFGDASVNHSTAAGAINTALNATRGLPAPILFVCEDNGWASRCRPRPAGSRRRTVPTGAGLRLRRRFRPVGRPDTDQQAVDQVRAPPAGLPAPAHRPLLGHAGTDAEMAYRRAPRRSRPTTAAIRCWRPPGAAGRRARAADELERYEAIRRRGRCRGGRGRRRPARARRPR